ncbi:cytochrome P450 [Linderina pennispora]|uniref:Cytochrome P450 n=1 Tax=Linderina pennispora TaxID=61395 RepID=A0A1Y1W560_9FUNG|nr:cytochrome P450 [Linderina pennispora]ORX68650.1 cytochrome P450 [Linderina pennispora]
MLFDMDYQAISSSLIAPVAALAIAIYVASAIRHAFFSPLSSIPGPVINKFSSLPLLFKVMTGQYHAYSTELHAKYGEIVRIGASYVSLSNTSDTRLVLATHGFKKGVAYTKGQLTKQNSFSTVDPEFNKVRRRQIGDTFAMHTLRGIEDLVVGAGANSLIKAWDAEISKQGGAARVNYFYALHRMGFDVIGAVGFGQNFNILQTGNTEVIDNMQSMMHLKSIITVLPFVNRVPWLFPKLKKSAQSLLDFIGGAIRMRRQLIETTGAPPRVDILQKMIDASDPATGQILDGDNLVSEVGLMLIAGTDTTSNTLSYTLTHLLHNPGVYRRATEEVRSVFPDASQTISFNDAKSKLPYLSAVIHEAMRLNPSVSGLLPRQLPADGATIQGHHIPKDAQICISVFACQRNPRTWDNPNVFDPERFLGTDLAEKLKDVLTFSSGVRVCIGQNLAWVEIYTVLANILRRYNFSLPEDAPYGPHRLNRLGVPVEIPAASFIVTGPRNPKDNCCVSITLAAA